MNERNLRISVVVADLFEAASAFYGAVGLVVGFMGIPVSILAGTVFTDFTVPALILAVVVGGSALAAAVITAYEFGPRHFDALASALAGCITVGWLTVEMTLIGIVSWAQVFWLVVGVVMIGLAALLWQAESYVDTLSASHQPI